MTAPLIFANGLRGEELDTLGFDQLVAEAGRVYDHLVRDHLVAEDQLGDGRHQVIHNVPLETLLSLHDMVGEDDDNLCDDGNPHTPDLATVSRDADAPLGILDVNRSRCGASGSFYIPEQINW